MLLIKNHVMHTTTLFSYDTISRIISEYRQIYFGNSILMGYWDRGHRDPKRGPSYLDSYVE